jgi:outer membrane protein
MRFSSLGMLAALLVSSAAMADSPWGLNLGATMVNPKSSTGTLVTGVGDVSSEVSNASTFTPAIEYTFAPNWVGEILLAVPMSHDVKLTGKLNVPGVGVVNWNGSKEARFTELPPTFSIKYLLSPDTEFSPYVSLGLNYTLVYNVKSQGDLEALGVKTTASNSFGAAAGTGFEYRPKGSAWGVGVDIRYINIRSEVKLDGDKVGTLSVNPFTYTLGANYHF